MSDAEYSAWCLRVKNELWRKDLVALSKEYYEEIYPKDSK